MSDRPTNEERGKQLVKDMKLSPHIGMLHGHLWPDGGMDELIEELLDAKDAEWEKAVRQTCGLIWGDELLRRMGIEP